MASATANGWQISPEEFPSADWAMMSTTTTGRSIGARRTSFRLTRDAKERCGHGKWLAWLEREFGWTDDTALRFSWILPKTVTCGIWNCLSAASICSLLRALPTKQDKRTREHDAQGERPRSRTARRFQRRRCLILRRRADSDRAIRAQPFGRFRLTREICRRLRKTHQRASKRRVLAATDGYNLESEHTDG